MELDFYGIHLLSIRPQDAISSEYRCFDALSAASAVLQLNVAQQPELRLTPPEVNKNHPDGLTSDNQ